MSFLMKPTDSLRLAATKLRVHKVRLVVTVFIMSLLFASLVFVSIMIAGVVGSVEKFGKEGLGDRYLVSAAPMTYFPFSSNKELKASLEATHKNLADQKVALAKKYNIPYDPKTDQSLPLTMQPFGPGPADVEQVTNINSPLTLKALEEQNAKLPAGYKDFQKVATAAGATATFQGTSQFSGFSGPSSAIKVLENGKEDYGKDDKQGQFQPTGLQSITSIGWVQLGDKLLQPFLLPGQSTALGRDGSIPVVAPFSAAEELLKLQKLPPTATNSQKLERLAAVRADVSGKTAAVCYRNQASQMLLGDAISQQTEMEANKANKDYVAPGVQYALPTTACGPVTVKKDSRTADQKKADNQKAELDAITTPEPIPQQGLFNLRIVGITADFDPQANSISAGGILSSILSSNVGQGWISPTGAFKPGSFATLAQSGTVDDLPRSQQQYFAEFGSLAEARRFIDQQKCDLDIYQAQDPTDTLKVCADKGKYFNVMPYGNNAGAIADLKDGIWKVVRYALLGVVVIAALVLMGTVGKIIADSRRETAVFRALGARRLQISQIYLTYVVMVGLMIVVFSFAIGVIAALIANQRLEPGLSVSAVLAYNARDIHQKFGLVGFDTQYLLAIAGLVLATSLAAALLPLIINMRRNPIRDMRDE